VITYLALCDCGHPSTPQEDGSGGTGFGRDSRTGRTACYSCCDARTRAQMARGEPQFLYLSGDGRRRIHTWSGGDVASVTSLRSAAVGFQGHGRGGTRRYFVRAVTAEGVRYYGTGAGPGMYVRLRANRGQEAQYTCRAGQAQEVRA